MTVKHKTPALDWRQSHEKRLEVALRAYKPHVPPDRIPGDYIAYFVVATAMPRLWDILGDRVMWPNGGIDDAPVLEAISTGERLMVELADHLFNDARQARISLGDLIDRLDRELWAAVLWALDVRRHGLPLGWRP